MRQPQHHRAPEQDRAGVWRHGRLFQPSAAGRRRWARVLDGLLVVLLAATATAAAFGLYGAGAVSLDRATGVMLLSYPLALLTAGALYGCTVSPGQALMGVVSLRSPSGRRVGFWRGMGRYFAVGFFPIVLVAAVLWIMDAPAPSSEPVRVYRRQL